MKKFYLKSFWLPDRATENADRTVLLSSTLSKLYLAFFAILLMAASANASLQNTTTIDSTWTLDTTVNNVDCYYKFIVCGNDNLVYLRFDNKNSSQVSITWIDVVSTQHEANVESFVGNKVLTLDVGESPEYTCSSSLNSTIVIPSKIHPAYKASIAEYKFNVISVQ